MMGYRKRCSRNFVFYIISIPQDDNEFLKNFDFLRHMEGLCAQVFYQDYVARQTDFLAASH